MVCQLFAFHVTYSWLASRMHHMPYTYPAAATSNWFSPVALQRKYSHLLDFDMLLGLLKDH